MSWSNLFFVSLFSAAGVFVGLAVGFCVVFAIATWLDGREQRTARRSERRRMLDDYGRHDSVTFTKWGHPNE